MLDLFTKIKNNAPLIMGIVNVTPDSFFDGGDYNAPQAAINHGLELLGHGADILDIGGESTRPNAEIVSVEDEIARVLPVIKGLKEKAKFISIDTRNAATMHAAIMAGANIINDVSALTHDPESMGVAAQSALPICLMHMKGTPQTMQNEPTYTDVIDEIMKYFEKRLEECEAHGINPSRVIIDPGIGFGKTLEHNLLILKNLNRFQVLGCPVLLGVSRKSFIGTLDQNAKNAKDRLGGSLAAALYGAFNGDAQILRVHDVADTRQSINVYHAISSAGSL
ncbi:MAG: dihydropteroate synthase [Alphaproteobacteria bacterium]